MTSDDPTVAIIAGGKSRRFGEPKPWASLNGKRLIEYAIDLSTQLSDKVFIINGKTLDYSHLGITTIEDEIKDCGPIGGLYTALKYAKTENIIIMPVDMPYLNAHVYKELLKHLDKTRPVIACSGTGMEPLVSIWHKENILVIKSIINKNQFSLRTPIKALNAIVVDLPKEMTNYSEDYFININYKDDLKKIKQVTEAG